MKSVFTGAILVILIVLGWEAIFTVEQTQQAIVLQFGELQRVHNTPGLKIKIPFVQEVIFYDRRVLDLDSTTPVRITTSDQKRLLVDSYTRYRIEDPIVFYRSVKPADEIGARSRLEVLVSSAIRNVLGRGPLRDLLSEERSRIMHQIQEEVKTLAKSLGIDVIDVRIIRAELPSENRKGVFARMNSELYRIAKANRADGAKVSQTIKAEADLQCSIIQANAQKTAEITRGEGDKKAAAISAEALGKDPEFYAFYRTMQIYRDVFQGNTTFVLTTDSDLLKFIEHNNIQTNKK